MSDESRQPLGSRVAAARHERERAARQSKLDDMREQVAAGRLVIRSMTDEERTRWAAQQASSDASATPSERARRARELLNRRRRAERLESL